MRPAPSGLPLAAPEVQLIRARRHEDESAFRARVRTSSAPAGAFLSRSYRLPYALIARHDGPVGVDIERVAPCAPGFAASISTPDELERRRSPTGASRPGNDEEAISLWCSKEALAKALGDARRYDPRRLEAPLAWPGGRSGAWRAARLVAPDGHVAWLCWREVGAEALTPRGG